VKVPGIYAYLMFNSVDLRGCGVSAYDPTKAQYTGQFGTEAVKVALYFGIKCRPSSTWPQI
jgi:hypothetical protein